MTARKWQPRGPAAPRRLGIPPEQEAILLHCLGICEHHGARWTVGGWRDHYCPGGDSVAICKRMAHDGWLNEVHHKPDGFPRVYRSTLAARAVLRLLGWVVESKEDET